MKFGKHAFALLFDVFVDVSVVVHDENDVHDDEDDEGDGGSE